eukprot:SAG11_NODE_10213_length_846_cov_1.848728_2_plen_78_part_00
MARCRAAMAVVDHKHAGGIAMVGMVSLVNLVVNVVIQTNLVTHPPPVCGVPPMPLVDGMMSAIVCARNVRASLVLAL